MLHRVVKFFDQNGNVRYCFATYHTSLIFHLLDWLVIHLFAFFLELSRPNRVVLILCCDLFVFVYFWFWERVIRPRSSNNVAILNTNMSTVVFADRRTRDQLQVMSCGHPMVVLSHCSQFWEGKHKSIWQLTNEDRS